MPNTLETEPILETIPADPVAPRVVVPDECQEPEQAVATLRRLEAADTAPVLVRIPPRRADRARELLAAGGRVLNVTAQGKTIEEAVARAYKAIDEDIDWPEGFCRRDIAKQAL